MNTGEDVKVDNYDEYKRMMRIWYEISKAWTGASSGASGSGRKDAAGEYQTAEYQVPVREYQVAEIPDIVEVRENMGVEVSYYSDGTICGLSGYEYDETGNLTGKNIYFRDGTRLGRYEWEYDEYGNRIGERCFNRKWEEEDKKRKWEYDDAGNMVIEYYDSGRGRKEYEYDGGGNLIRETCLDVIQKDWVYEYDEAGRLIESRGDYYYFSNGYENYIRKYEYDEAGNMTSEVWYLNGILFQRYEYEYDPEGKRTSTTYYDFDLWGREEAFQYRKEFRYDNTGKKTGETVYREDGSIHMRTEFIGIRHDI